MKTLLVLLTLALSLFTAQATSVNANEKNAAKEMRRQIFLKRTGGLLRDVTKQKGRIVIVNAQSKADEEWLRDGAKVFSDDAMIDVDVEKGNFDIKKPDIRGEASIFVVDDETLPPSLVAPECGWAMVNAASFHSEKDPYFRMRIMKAITRAAAFLLGGGDSQFPNCVTGIIRNNEELDSYPDSRLPVDVLDRLRKNTIRLGIVPYSITTYRSAVQEGWAPAPTNEYQQAIWDKVHAVPSNPMKIEFDPKKGR